MLRGIVLLAAALLAALNAGFFFTWSFTVMNGLDAATPETAIGAMQAMNANIRNAPFGIVFFGTPLIAFLAALLSFTGNTQMPLPQVLIVIAALMALLATVAVTATVHIPLNVALATATPDSTGNAVDIWQAYSAEWTAWNHLRAATSLMGCLLLILAFRLDRRH